MYIGKTLLAFCLTWALILTLFFGQKAENESISARMIDLNRQTYNQLQLERSKDRTINEEQMRKIIPVEIIRATSSNPNILIHTGEPK
ncbi:hypothetical protein [Pseudomonas sp. MF6768]|uniref:hypothetical protein n=1 Tax=Pseudomonas sp. MF6768 TaxID=2797532 RepID=UPI0018E77CD2|nr:hypothetical protein [Pseudomonas sp. MF6768]MBJ2242507.1 hypothetical protein [Pseudomonas sp. MF6768]